MVERYTLYQRATTSDGVLYEMDIFVPYAEGRTEESVKEQIAEIAPEDIALGSIAKFHSADENGSEFIWEFEWEQNVEEEKLFMLTHETYIDRVPNGEVVPTGTIEITENGEGIDVSEYAYADVNVSGGGDLSTAEVTLVVADGHSSFGLNCDSGDGGGYIGNFLTDGEFFEYSYVGSDTSPKTFKLVYVGDSINVTAYSVVTSATGAVTYEDSGIVTISGDCTITGYADD